MTSRQKPRGGLAKSRIARCAVFALLAFGIGAVSSPPATAQFSAEIVIGSPPPPVRFEPVPPPMPGYVWAPGYWLWNGRQHVWYAGHWEVARAEEQFVGAAWVQTPMGWRFVPGHWERGERFDRDRFERERFERERLEHERFERERGREFFCPPGLARQGRC